jgi:putative methionine-R-sulfoxide reductase with GAF domain
MQQESMLGSDAPDPRHAALSAGQLPPSAGLHEPIRFPPEDSSKSLTEMARRDLAAALQLLAERAQYITAASGAAIALRKGGPMVCYASAGPSAPELGTELHVGSGLSGESVRTRQILRCDDAESDARVNRESCRALGIASVVVLPLIADNEVIGVFELFSSRPHAFEERDIVALQRLAEMIQTALQHADAVKRAEKEILPSLQGDSEEPAKSESRAAEAMPPAHEDLKKETEEAKTETEEAKTETAVELAQVPSTGIEALLPPNRMISFTSTDDPAEAQEDVIAPAWMDGGKIGKCVSCGFPVSEGRALCVDCEQGKGGLSVAAVPSVPGFLSEVEPEQGWFESHKYLVFALLALLIVLTLILRPH